MRIGIIGPSVEEIMPFIENISAKKTSTFAMLNFYSGNFKGVDVVSLYCGVCKVNAAIAAQLLIDKFNVTHIIVTGVAGGIDTRLNIGDTVISTEVAYHDVEADILTQYHPWMKSIYFKVDNTLLEICKKVLHENTFNHEIYFGRIVTGESFITNNMREEIINKFNPLCVDMETGSIAHVCYANSIPFLAIRSITDTEDHSGVETFENNCQMASLNSINILEKVLGFISEDINL
ncbi:5'-methylthioadenosine/adenosylhomocysteine nucleosidase [Clostridium perfringens]|nr:5'-methylthioadenosine/adenosylhomocysteine nucleosidase [Clostridium perfringens]